jgi:serine/threonine protein kinase/formylglycine-generating enzyme required for sulfatase activity
MIGKTISHYRILEKLGEGGMGVVYKAEDTKLRRTVALKFLSAKTLAGEAEKTRFIHEAQAAAALNHPNICTIYETGEFEAQPFIVMEFIEGQTLKEKVSSAGAGLSVNSVIEFALQIAEGLQAAHEKGIIHRDMKCDNVMVNEKGVAKIMDFGLAKLSGRTQVTQEGTTLGTISYMSPEQARGEKIDHRTDIWSFGVMLYEMVTGSLPFNGEYDQAVMYSILNEEPEQMAKDVPEKLQEIILHALEKDPEKRFQSFDQIASQFKKMQGVPAATEGKPTNLNFLMHLLKRPGIAFAALAVIIFLMSIALIPYYQLLKRQQAEEKLHQIKSLVKDGKYSEAFHLAKQEEKHLRNDSTFIHLIPGYSDFLTVISKPEGARVYLKRFAPDEKRSVPQREYAGLTPIHNLQVIRGGYKVYVEKDGFAPNERVFSSAFSFEGLKRTTDIAIEINLLDQKKMIKNMVFVPGGVYHLVGWDAPTTSEVRLNDYYIDKYEVSNKDFKSFINAGGYQKKEYWKFAFIKEGKHLSWDDAIALFADRTGLQGPRDWINQEYPVGKDHYPVTNITWYEAEAYAEFANKKLPTIFQWEKAARNGEYQIYDLVMPWGVKSPNENILQRANFQSNATVAVDSLEFGIGPYGGYNMAGNVTEWCLNETNNGYIATGGSWQDPVYTFAYFGAFPSFYSSNTIGFRCVRTVGMDTGQQGKMKINVEERVPVYQPVDEKTYSSFPTLYKYDKKPLNPKIIETTETADWVKEKITFSGVDNDPIIAYLYLPKRAAKPYQCLEWIPHSGVINGHQRADEAAEAGLGSQIKPGRALLAIVPIGAIERPHKPGFEQPEIETVKYREQIIRYVTEFRLGLDYLATRKDIDMDKLAFLGTSWGSTNTGIILAAIENRYRAVIFLAGGIHKYSVKMLPEVNPINFASLIKPPKLLLNGQYDEAFPLETEARPFYKLLREPKQLSLVESGHAPPLEKRVPIINKFLDETLGPVKFE